MRLWSVFLKSMREQLRDPMTLFLTVIFAPLFVLLYWLWFPSGSTTYGVLVINRDIPVGTADGGRFSAAREAIAALEDVTYANGQPMLRVLPATDQAAAEAALRDRQALVLLTFPPDFSTSIQAARSGERPTGEQIVFGGDLTNPYYPIAAILVISAIDGYIQEATGIQPPVGYTEVPLGASAARSEFEIYVPGLLVLGAVLLIFSAAMAITREVEAGRLRRLQITRLTVFELLGGISLSLMLVAAASVLLTFATAVALGFRSQGPLWLAVLVGVITSLSTIGIGLLMACFVRTVAQAFIIANFPLALMMFFTGAIFPVPRLELFTIGGRGIALNDVLPPAHAVIALNKIFTLGAGIQDVLYELGALTMLSIVYLGLGIWLFQQRHLQAV